MSFLANIPLSAVPGVGPKRAEILKCELGVESAEDMLYVFPFRYIDRSSYVDLSDLSSQSTYVQCMGTLSQPRLEGIGRKTRLVAAFYDSTATVDLLWFKNVNSVRATLAPGQRYVLFGKPSFYGGHASFVHPELEVEQRAAALSQAGGLRGIYRTSAKMKSGKIESRQIQNIILSILQNYLVNNKLAETLPDYILNNASLLPLDFCLRSIHFPKDAAILEKVRYRLKFEELFYIQLKLLRRSSLGNSRPQGLVFGRAGKLFNDFYFNHLPFSLTGAQKRVIKEVSSDMLSGYHMNRLLQGDVGSGKTLVAVMCCLLAIDGGYQACIMAPTEILATQHFLSIGGLLAPLGINVRLLTGSVKQKQRREIDSGLRDGSVDLLVGTHALIEDSVVFRNLGLAVIDEQHRFGVEQRAMLWKKNSPAPHVLVMTATPIPRTLAMTLYGDLDVSVIDELPPGREPVKTVHFTESGREGVYNFIRKEVDSGRQAYIVYPLIKESEKLDFKDLMRGYEALKQIYPEPRYHICMMHGSMSPEEKDSQMALFSAGKAQIMVATTVIEVGVNVPNATVMLIESAERFGLSQLHQLRGRVGRGGGKSYCILVTRDNQSAMVKQKMDVMTQSNDGFEISEVDMKLRGPGDIEGTSQSGLPFDLKIANLAHDGAILQHARDIARLVLENDPRLEADANQILKAGLDRRVNGKDWGEIS